MRQEDSDNSLVSVVIPVFNVAPYLRECVDSVLMQSYQNLELILVDDGSTDESPSICDEYAIASNNVKVIHKRNGGLSEARNVGIEYAHGEYLTFVDSDDWLESNMIQRCVDLINYYDADFCGVSFMLAYPEKMVPNPTCCSKPEIYSTEEALARYLFNSNISVCVCGGVYRTELWNGVRCPVGKLHEDQHTKYLLLDRASRVVFDPEPLYYYRQREGSIGHSSFDARSYDLLDGVDKQYTYISNKYPSIEPDIAAACSFWYVVFVNMMLRSGQKDTKTVEYCQRFVRAHLDDIIRSPFFSLSRKIQLSLFALSYQLYGEVYLFYIENSGEMGAR